MKESVKKEGMQEGRCNKECVKQGRFDVMKVGVKKESCEESNVC